MYRSQMEQYFQSENYLKHEIDSVYCDFMEILKNSLDINTFMDCEEKLHTIIIEKTEFAFEAGYTAGFSHKK